MCCRCFCFCLIIICLPLLYIFKFYSLLLLLYAVDVKTFLRRVLLGAAFVLAMADGVVAIFLFSCCVAVFGVPCLFYVDFLFSLGHVFLLCRVGIVDVSSVQFACRLGIWCFVFCHFLFLNGTIGDLFVAYLSCCVCVNTFVAQPMEEFLILFLFRLCCCHFVARCLGIFCSWKWRRSPFIFDCVGV